MDVLSLVMIFEPSGETAMPLVRVREVAVHVAPLSAEIYTVGPDVAGIYCEQFCVRVAATTVPSSDIAICAQFCVVA